MSGEYPARITSSVMGSMVWFIGLVVFLLPQVAPVKAAAAPKRILALYWYNKDFPSNPAFDRSFQAALKSAPAGSIEYYSEYLESDRFPGENQSKVLRDYLRQKYANRPIDVVVAVSDVPLEFLLKYRDSLFTRTPIVFLAIKRPATNELSGPGLTGIVLGGGYRKTLDLALTLHPGTKQVFIISGTLDHNKTYEALCRKELQGLDSGISINYLTDLSVDELIFKAKRLPERSLVLYIWQQSQHEGQLLESADILAAIAPSTTAPIYGVAAWQVGQGVVGGYLRTFEADGTRVGEIALRIASGARAQDIPIESAKREPIFDWGQLHRWGLKESALPPGSIVLNRQPTLWESYKWYIVSGICLLLAQTSLIIGLLWQRANRRKAEADLALTYERLRGIVSSAMDAIIATDNERRIVLFNNAAEEMFGFSEQEALGAPIDRFIPQRFRSTHSAHMRSFGESAATTRVMGGLCAMRANGQEFPIDASISQVESAGTKLYTVIIRDITERLQAETAVKESEERFRLVANTAPVMIWTTGTDKLCNYVNKPWLDFAGRTLEQELGSGWAEGIHNEDVFNCLTTYTEAFDRREQFEMQYRLRRHDGEFRWVLDIGVPRFNADSTFAGYIGSCIDITERKRAEEALSTIGRRLIEAHEEERAWIGRELHDDINQRLALLAVELDQWSMDQSQSTFTEHLRHAQSRITEIAKDVQALSHRLHSSKLDYLGLAVAAKSFCGELSGQAKVEVQFSHSAVPSTMPKEVSLCLFRVLQEALQNAIKHSGVRLYYVNLRGTADRVELTVSDDGRGFDEQMGFTSQGLGLISMRERLQIVNGVLDIQTQPGAGTTISARVPLHAELQAKAG